MATLDIEHLRVRRRTFQLDVRDLTVRPGVTMLLGPNGAGKSTMLGAIAGSVRAEARIVRCGNAELSPGHVSLLPQRPDLPKDLTAAMFLEHVCWLGGRSRQAARERARHTLQELGLEQNAELPVRRLSGGYDEAVGVRWRRDP